LLWTAILPWGVLPGWIVHLLAYFDAKNFCKKGEGCPIEMMLASIKWWGEKANRVIAEDKALLADL